MSLSISPYSQPYKSNIENISLPFDLIGKVLEYKQNLYDKNLNALQSFKQTALNINFLNKERQQEVDELNRNLDEKFSSLNNDYSDLSDSQKFNQYVSWFDGFRKNTDLIKAYQEDKKWQNEYSKIQSLKQSKDPVKAGFSSINEFVFNHGLNNYVNSTKNNPTEFKGYTPYTDVVSETTRIYKSLPKKEWTETIPDLERPGYMKVVKMSGYTQDDLKSVMDSMSSNMKEQFRIEAEYTQLRGLSTNPTAYREGLFDNYTKLFQDKQNYWENKLSESIQKQALTNNPQEKESLEKDKQFIQQQITELGLNARTKEWFQTTDESNLLNFTTQLHTERKLGALSKGLSNRPSIEYKPDMAYWTNVKLRQSNQQFQANLAYKASQDAVQNQFREKDLELKKQDMLLDYQAKMAKAKSKSDSESGDSSNGSVTSFFNQPELLSKNNPMKKGDLEAFDKVERDMEVKSFNIADGRDYKITFMDRKQSNDQILEAVVKMYDDSNIGGSTQKIREYLTKANLTDNISLNTLVDSLPIMATEFGNLDIKNKVGFVKTRLNQILDGDTNVLQGKYKNFAVNSNIYRNQKQEEVSFNNTKARIYKEVVLEKGLPQDWNQMNESQRNIVRESVKNEFIEKQLLPSYVPKYFNFSDLGDQPKEGQEQKWADQGGLARLIKEKHNVQFNLPQQLIESAYVYDDGTTTVQFRGEKEFQKIYGDNYNNVIQSGSLWWKDNVVKGKDGYTGAFEPNGTLTFKTKPLNRESSLDRILANGNTYYDAVKVNGQNIPIQFTATSNGYYIQVGDLPRWNEPRIDGQSPSQVYNLVKQKVIQSYSQQNNGGK